MKNVKCGKGRVIRELNKKKRSGGVRIVVEKNEKSTAAGIPRRSPIQVLTGPDVA